jgi:hypothetical protein
LIFGDRLVQSAASCVALVGIYLGQQVGNHSSVSSLSFENLLAMLLDALKSVGKVYCVADALDEMDPEASYFLDRLADLGLENPSQTEVFVTSRQNEEVERPLKDPLSVKLKLNRHRVDGDINVYIHSCLTSVVDASLLPETRSRIEFVVKTKCNGVFLYARLMLDKLTEHCLAPQKNLKKN